MTFFAPGCKARGIHRDGGRWKIVTGQPADTMDVAGVDWQPQQGPLTAGNDPDGLVQEREQLPGIVGGMDQTDIAGDRANELHVKLRVGQGNGDGDRVVDARIGTDNNWCGHTLFLSHLIINDNCYVGVDGLGRQGDGDAAARGDGGQRTGGERAHLPTRRIRDRLEGFAELAGLAIAGDLNR